jgi:hypothetical protein
MAVVTEDSRRPLPRLRPKPCDRSQYTFAGTDCTQRGRALFRTEFSTPICVASNYSLKAASISCTQDKSVSPALCNFIAQLVERALHIASNVHSHTFRCRDRPKKFTASCCAKRNLANLRAFTSEVSAATRNGECCYDSRDIAHLNPFVLKSLYPLRRTLLHILRREKSLTSLVPMAPFQSKGETQVWGYAFALCMQKLAQLVTWERISN